VKTLQVVLLVRRMDVVVVEAEAHQHGIEAERALEIRDDRDRTSTTDQQRVLAHSSSARAGGGPAGFMFQSSAIPGAVEWSVNSALQSAAVAPVT